jgi:hypothetical protein
MASSTEHAERDPAEGVPRVALAEARRGRGMCGERTGERDAWCVLTR